MVAKRDEAVPIGQEAIGCGFRAALLASFAAVFNFTSHSKSRYRRPGVVTGQTMFQEKKKKILKQLNTPDAEYSDLSPKGSVDEGIRDLISDINEVSGLVTTSSCA